MWCSAIGCIVTLTLSMLAVPLAAEAQRQTKVYRVGQLHAGSPSTSQPYIVVTNLFDSLLRGCLGPSLVVP